VSPRLSSRRLHFLRSSTLDSCPHSFVLSLLPATGRFIAVVVTADGLLSIGSPPQLCVTLRNFVGIMGWVVVTHKTLLHLSRSEYIHQPDFSSSTASGQEG
jgi:hypothetical protein